MVPSRMITAILLVAVAAAVRPAAARAQDPEAGADPVEARRMLSLLVGGFTYDRAGDRTFPMAAVRADWPLSRFVLAEVGVSLARAEVENVIEAFQTRPGIGHGPAVVEEDSNIFTGTVGLQAQLPLRYVQPYVGLATGLFGRMDPPGGARFVRPTQTFAVGLRIPVTGAFGVRGDLRYRLDQHQGGDAASDFEQTIGITWSY